MSHLQSQNKLQGQSNEELNIESKKQNFHFNKQLKFEQAINNIIESPIESLNFFKEMIIKLLNNQDIEPINEIWKQLQEQQVNIIWQSIVYGIFFIFAENPYQYNLEEYFNFKNIALYTMNSMRRWVQEKELFGLNKQITKMFQALKDVESKTNQQYTISTTSKSQQIKYHIQLGELEKIENYKDELKTQSNLISKLKNGIEIRENQIKTDTKSFHEDLLQLKNLYSLKLQNLDFSIERELNILEKNILKEKTVQNYQIFIKEIKIRYDHKIEELKQKFKELIIDNEKLSKDISKIKNNIQNETSPPILIQRAFQHEKNPYKLWKIIQDAKGIGFFQPVFENQNPIYDINYEELNSVLTTRGLKENDYKLFRDQLQEQFNFTKNSYLQVIEQYSQQIFEINNKNKQSSLTIKQYFQNHEEIKQIIDNLTKQKIQKYKDIVSLELQLKDYIIDNFDKVNKQYALKYWRVINKFKSIFSSLISVTQAQGNLSQINAEKEMRKIVDSIKGILFNNKLVDQKIKDEFQEIHLQLIHSENINEEWQIKYLQERIDADMKQKNYENQHQELEQLKKDYIELKAINENMQLKIQMNELTLNRIKQLVKEQDLSSLTKSNLDEKNKLIINHLIDHNKDYQINERKLDKKEQGITTFLKGINQKIDFVEDAYFQLQHLVQKQLNLIKYSEESVQTEQILYNIVNTKHSSHKSLVPNQQQEVQINLSQEQYTEQSVLHAISALSPKENITNNSTLTQNLRQSFSKPNNNRGRQESIQIFNSNQHINTIPNQITKSNLLFLNNTTCQQNRNLSIQITKNQHSYHSSNSQVRNPCQIHSYLQENKTQIQKFSKFKSTVESQDNAKWIQVLDTYNYITHDQTQTNNTNYQINSPLIKHKNKFSINIKTPQQASNELNKIFQTLPIHPQQRKQQFKRHNLLNSKRKLSNQSP